MRGPGADNHYWDALTEGRLEMQHCSSCHEWHWPAVWRCGECGSWEQEWHEVPMVGKIFTWTRCWYDFGAPRELELPFVSVVVELDGDCTKRVVGTLTADSDNIQIGMPVTGRIEKFIVDGEEMPALRWTLLANQQEVSL